MPKKVAKGSSRSGGAAREFQRRTRVGDPTSGGSVATDTLKDNEGVVITAAPTSSNGSANGSNGTATSVTPRASASPSISANTRYRGTVSPSAAPRPGSATRSAAPLYGGPLGARARSANALSLTVEDEVSYIKGDIRRLIILAIVCFVALIVLGFLLTR